MSYTLYDTSIVPAKQALTALASIIRKALDHPSDKNLLTVGLHDDMKPLSFQIIFAASLAEKLVARLSGTPVPEPTTELSSLADALALTEKGLEVLNGADKTLINGNAENMTEVGMGPGVNIPMRTDAYASAFALPNINFHVVTAYAILRKEGVPLGKRDYLGAYMGAYLPQK
ncbi:uncharacterized protein N7484_005837 [Penicillium longicatenatum]|uniref:uncharacterized protein n=1 Tax=Penicillium longicatenatum TaxID=1561947 RepID=UPI0025497AE0|nr:uncharacterized protein N7484_005837 [Penicillium longicatenatum]KAJ5643330.1 hypothetical protein N7484_005837 [Penicillium longicatenatum]KAJ5645280.1 hypothetical protein N7507_011291 [Penicillium longicatenatum]